MSEDFQQQLYLQRYIADRTHELELEKIAGALERTFLQVAGVLNGASATVFISFLASTADKVKTNPFLLTMTFVLWISGLCVSIIAGASAYKAQQHFMSEYRVRRHEGGLRLFETEYRRASGVNQEHSAAHFAQRANNENSSGEMNWSRARRFGLTSIIFFFIGAVFALATVLMATH